MTNHASLGTIREAAKSAVHTHQFISVVADQIAKHMGEIHACEFRVKIDHLTGFVLVRKENTEKTSLRRAV